MQQRGIGVAAQQEIALAQCHAPASRIADLQAGGQQLVLVVLIQEEMQQAFRIAPEPGALTACEEPCERFGGGIEREQLRCNGSVAVATGMPECRGKRAGVQQIVGQQ
ncbi:hypothetical protein GCM10027419_34010 [Pandoraea terrae]